MNARKDLLRLARERHNFTTKELVITFLDLYELTDLTILTNRVNTLAYTGQLSREQLNQLRILKLFLNHLIPDEFQKVF